MIENAEKYELEYLKLLNKECTHTDDMFQPQFCAERIRDGRWLA